MVIRRTRRHIKKAARGLRRRAAARDEQAWPRYDLREDLRRDVQRAHDRMDRLLERSERLRAKYRKEADVRWLERSEAVGTAQALEAYREAAARAAVINRLYRTVARHHRLETCERQALRLIRQQLGGTNPDRKFQSGLLDAVGALHKYLHVERSRDNDRRVRRRLNRLGSHLAARGADNAFLFRVPLPKAKGKR